MEAQCLILYFRGLFRRIQVLELTLALLFKINEQSKWIIQVLKDMLHIYVMDLEVNGSSIQVLRWIFFKALYGRHYQSLISWFQTFEVSFYGTDLHYDSLDRFQVIQDRLRVTQSRKKSHDNRRLHVFKFGVGDQSFP